MMICGYASTKRLRNTAIRLQILNFESWIRIKYI
jgi:hypothetical protein